MPAPDRRQERLSHTRVMAGWRCFYKPVSITECTNLRRRASPPLIKRNLQGSQEVEDVLLGSGRKGVEVRNHGVCLGAATGMGRDRRQQIARPAVVQEEDSLSDTPQWRGSKLASSRNTLADAVGE